MTNLALPKADTDTVASKAIRPECDKLSKFAQKRNAFKDNKSVNKPQPPANKNAPPKKSPPKPTNHTEEEHVLETGNWPESLPKTLSMVLAMAWHDHYLKEALIENPMEIVGLLGVTLPEGVNIKAEDIRGNCCITILEYSHEMGIHRRGMSLKLDLVAEM